MVNGEGLCGRLLPFTNSSFSLCFPPFRCQQLPRPVTLRFDTMPSGLKGEKPPKDGSDEGGQIYWSLILPVFLS